MANPVVHFEVMVKGDAEAIRKFYAEVFGWKFKMHDPMNYGIVDNAGAGINGGIGEPMHGEGYQTFYVAVDDLQQTLNRIESLGGRCHMPPTDIPNGPKIAMFKDPAGSLIGLVKNM